MERLTYPPARRCDQVDDYHGTAVADPYRWLEDLDSAETRAWVEAQSALTEAYLAAIPQREALRDRLTAIWDYERFGVPVRAGDRYAYARNSGLQNQNVIYLCARLDGPAEVLLDPNAFSGDGTVALSSLSFSDDGRYVAYATATSGSDWLTWRVRDVARRIDLADELRWSKFSGASWLPDGSGFYYCRYDEPSPEAQFKDENVCHQVWFHRIGTAQAADELVYHRPDHKDWNFGPEVSEDGRWLVIDANAGTDPNNRIFVLDLQAPGTDPIAMLDAGDASYRYLGNDRTTFYFQTTKDAPRGRVVAIDLHAPVPVEIVAEQDDALLSTSLFGETLVLQYLRDAIARVRRADLRGRALGDVALPGLGSAGGFGGKRHHGETFFHYTSYTTPAAIYRLDVASGATAPVFAPRVDFEPAAFVSEQRFYTSPDGTRIPLIVSAKRGVLDAGPVPTILYGYGGFNIPLTPGFSPSVAVWMERGGAFAVANVRGGGEYGEAWHLAGTRERKQNVFDDFIAAAEYLIASGIATPATLAISGGSNGGLLVGACMTQRPELFAAAVPAVGVLDMLRFQKFTIGWAWTSDYGSADEPDAFRYLLAYSPLHALRPGTAYPATLVITADHDDRVYPAHSFKFAAALQAAQGGAAPVLIRIESKAGHGAGKPTAKLIAEAADRYAFLAHILSPAEGGSGASQNGDR